MPLSLVRCNFAISLQVCGYGITFDVDCSGNQVLSGSADGTLHYYNYRTGKNYRTRTVFASDDPSIAVKIHPFISSMVAVGSWSGKLNLLIWIATRIHHVDISVTSKHVIKQNRTSMIPMSQLKSCRSCAWTKKTHSVYPLWLPWYSFDLFI